MMPVAAECPGRGELTQFVPHHALGDKDGHMLAAIVDRDGVAHHLRENCCRERPGLEHLFLARLVHLLNARQQLLTDERSLFNRSAHSAPPSGLSGGIGHYSDRSVCPSCGCGNRWSARPTGLPDACLLSLYPRHLRADGRPGSWRCREPWASCPSNGCDLPCHLSNSRESYFLPRRLWRGSQFQPAAFHRTAICRSPSCLP